MDEIELPLTVDHLEAPLVKPTALHTVEFSSAQKESTPEKIANLTASFSSMSIATSPKCVLNSTNGENSSTTQNGPLLKKSSLKKVHIAAADKADNDDDKSSMKKEEKGKTHASLKVRMYHFFCMGILLCPCQSKTLYPLLSTVGFPQALEIMENLENH